MWLPTAAVLGSIHVPSGRLRSAARFLDTRSFARLVSRCRPAGSGSQALNDTGTPGDADAVRVHFDYYGGDGGLAMPYTMHPWFHSRGYQRGVARLRATPRRFRLAFAGSAGPAYDDCMRFPILTRSAVLECLLDTCRDDTLLVTDAAGLDAIDRTDRPIVVVLCRRDAGEAGKPHFLPPTRYLELLASADFALCPPGYTVPHSHNLIEALAVGTAPVLNYAHLYRPALTPGRNCLVFDTPDGLRRTVVEALALSPAAAAAFRGGAAAFYDAECRPEAFAAKLAAALSARPGPVPVAAVHEAIGPQLYQKALARGVGGE